MSPIAETLITALTKRLSGSLVKVAGRRLRQRLEDPERAQALERCCQAGVVAMLSTSDSSDEAERQLLEDIFRELFAGEEIAEDVGKEITQLTRGHRLDHEAMEELFAAAGFEAEKLPAVDLPTALDAFEGAFVAAAIEEKALQGKIDIPTLSETAPNPWLDSFGRSADDPDYEDHLTEISRARSAGEAR